MSQTPFIKQIRHFILHLRLHYQFFILSGGYLLSALFVEVADWNQFLIQFLNVHVFLFGGATAYNSFWDKDEGPVGGLKSPPEMEPWMWWFSMLMQYAGLLWAASVSLNYVIIYGVSMAFFWLYSSPLTRWKGKPILSLVAIGLSTGSNSYLLGYLAAGTSELGFTQGFTALGVACIILSLYPASQVYQMEEDTRRGDTTFAIRFGLKGVQRFFPGMFLSGLMITSFMLYLSDQTLGLLFFFVSLPAFVVISYIIWRLKGRKEEYSTVMKVKFTASFSFVLFILSVLLYQSLS